MSQSGFGIADGVLVGLGALAILVVGWLLARFAAVAARRALRRIGLADRLARMSDEADDSGEKVAQRISRLVFALVMVLVIALDLRLFVFPLVAEPLSALVVGTLRNGQMILDVGSVVWPIALALLATGALVLLLRTIGRFFPSVYARIASWRTTRIRPLRVQSVEFLSADRIADLLLRLAKGTRAVLVLVIVFVYVSLLKQEENG